MDLESIKTPIVVISQNHIILYVNPTGQEYFKKILNHELTIGTKCFTDINGATHICHYCPLDNVLLKRKVVNLDFTSELTGISYRITCIPDTYNGEDAVVEILERVE